MAVSTDISGIIIIGFHRTTDIRRRSRLRT